MTQSFGSLLKDWRAARRMSQLDLALAANISARHLSFLETGRAAPSRSMVMQLAETLEAPKADRNALLQAAGFAPAYRGRGLGDADMTAAREALEWTLSRHAPYPAIALDRHWRLIRANPPAGPLFAMLGVGPGDSLFDAFANASTMRETIENWTEVAQAVIARLRVETAHLGGDPVLARAIERLRREVGEAPHRTPAECPALVPARYRLGGRVFAITSIIAQFGSTEDIALADLKIELFFPADEPTKKLFEGAGG